MSLPSVPVAPAGAELHAHACESGWQKQDATVSATGCPAGDVIGFGVGLEAGAVGDQSEGET